MKTKLFTLLLAMATSFGTMFAYDARIDNLFYNLNTTDLTAEVTDPGVSWENYYTNNTTNVTIPQQITYNSKNYKVTSIGEGAFCGCTKLTTVVIPNTITSIGKLAFWNCYSLTSVTIPNSVTSIADRAFGYCRSMTSVTIPNSVTSIENRTFSNCTGLTSITIPNSVTSIGDYAFSGCTGLTDITIPNNVTSIGDFVFYCCTSLTSITIPNSVTSIESGAFRDCTSLTSITIPNSVTGIGEYAFEGCTGLTSVTIPSSLTNIGGNAFFRCSNLKNVTLCSNAIVSNAYSSSSSFKDIFGTQVTNYIIEPGVTSIGSYAFSGCTNLTSVTISNGVTSIGSYAFNSCSKLTSVTIPNGVTSISIGEMAFGSCTDLTDITIPNNVTSIGLGVFFGCSKLSSITVASDNLMYSSINGVLFDKDVTTLIQYPGGKSGAYTIPNSVTIIRDYAFTGCSKLTSVTIPNGVTSISIGEMAFGSCTGLTDITIPNNVTSIGEKAFEGCSGLLSVKIGNGITTINSYTFRSCTNLKSLVIGRNVNSIESAVFANCGNLTSVTIESNAIVSKKYTTTSNISNIFGAQVQEYILGTGIRKLGEYAFHGCTRVKAIRYLGWTAPSGSTSALDNICYAVAGGNHAPIYVPCGTLSTFEKSWWSRYDTRYAPIKYTVTGVVNSKDMGKVVSPYDECDDLVAKANEGYHFVQWSDGVTENPRHVDITKDTTFTAIFARNEYLIIWKNDDGTILETNSSVLHGTTPVYNGPTPIKPSDAQYTYTFAGWTPQVVKATSDTTYIATYKSTLNKYTITWQNEDGSTIDQTVVEYGQIPTHTEPSKPATAQYSYTFASWSPDVVAVTGDTTYTATYNSVVNTYTITWKNEDGSIIDQTEVAYGSIPTHTDPTKTATAEYTYTFAGWSPEVSAVTGNVTYMATYNATRNKYTVTFVDEDGATILKKATEYEYGAIPVAPADPTKAATAEYTYTFAGWSPEVVAVTGNATYTAVYTSTVNKYTITFMNDDGSVLCANEWEYGTMPSCAEPTKEDDEQYAYTFSGWTPELVVVTEDATYTATFAKNIYAITKITNSEHGTIIGNSQAEYLDVVTLEATPNNGYYFVRWADGNTDNPRTIKITQDTTMEAIFDYLLDGKCGKDNVLTWKFNPSAMALDITGKGSLSENYTYGTFIESLTIGNEVTVIGQNAFKNHGNLKHVVIGSSVKVLEQGAFYNCSGILTITCYSQRPPTVNADALYGLDYSTIVYVPKDYLDNYVMHDIWGLYDVRPLEAETVQTNDIKVTPSENTVEVVWPQTADAATYELVIKDKNGNVICTLVFNANGQLTQIAFAAPSRINAPAQAQAAGFAFTVTGLESGTTYDLTLTAKNGSGATLNSRTVSFSTQGPTALEDIADDAASASGTQKVMIDGQIYILRDGKVYNAVGAEVK